jgi:DNA-binding response OmpR family regulator
MAVLRQVREQFGWEVPVIFCTARTDEEAASDILRAWAPTITFPNLIRYMEFMARIHALLRRRKLRIGTLNFGGIEIDLDGRRIRLAGVDVDLTQREFELAVILLKNIGRVLSRDELLTSIWSARQRGRYAHRRYPRQSPAQEARIGWRERSDAEFRLWSGLPPGHRSAGMI